MTENNAITPEEARAVAEEHSKPGKFSFLDRLNSRNYPTEDVEIYLDEAAGYKYQKLVEQLGGTTDEGQVELINKQLDHLREEVGASRYIVHMMGISTEKYDAVVDLAQAEYPIEYDEYRNPLTAKMQRDVIPSEGRETLFRTHLWSEFIVSVEDHEGNVDDNISPEFVAVVMNEAPLMAQAKIQVAVDNLRMISGWMDEIQGEDFLAKS